MLNSNGTSVKEDEDDHEPKPGRGFADSTDEKSNPLLGFPKFGIGVIFPALTILTC